MTSGSDFHRGLAALLFQVVNRDDAPEVGYYREIIERSGGPALDAGCGPGRLLCQYLRAGLDVDGCDISPDMIDLCRRRAEAEGLTPSLHVQSNAGLDLPRRYRTIVSCGTFGLNGTRADDLESLRRFHAHLEPGGTLAVDVEAGWAMTEVWQRCADADRAKPGEWTTRDTTPFRTAARSRSAGGSSRPTRWGRRSRSTCATTSCATGRSSEARTIGSSSAGTACTR